MSTSPFSPPSPTPAPVAATGAVQQAVAAFLAGTASVEQQQLVDVVTDAATTLLGPLSELMALPWDELNPLQRWVRQQSSAADAARQSPPLSDMQEVFNLLVSTAHHSGPTLRLAPGANIVALDNEQRRYLIPAITHEHLLEIRRANDMREAKKASRKAGGVRYHWSVERTGLVPSPEKVTDSLPLPTGGCYLLIYQASIDVAGKTTFKAAALELIGTLPVADVLFWDQTGGVPTLWSLRGGFGHRGTVDVDLPEDTQAAAAPLRAALAANAF